jgi:dephospho-CoA kinase
VIVVGLTGSIGMGKSTAAAMFRGLGVPVYDADATVHRLFAPGGAAVAPIAAAFPGVVHGRAVDRGLLGARVFADAVALARLEAIVHPLVFRRRAAFLGHHRRRRTPVVVLDIPLLFETGADKVCDVVAVVSAPAFLQEQRMLRRPGMTRRRLAAIRARQMDDAEKRRRADVVISTGLGRAVTQRAIRRLVAELTRRSTTAETKSRRRPKVARRR